MDVGLIISRTTISSVFIYCIFCYLLLFLDSRIHGWCFHTVSTHTEVLASEFHVNIFGAFTENPTQDTFIISSQKFVEKVSLKIRSLSEIMAPGRKRRSVRSDDVHENTATSPPLSQTASSVGITRAELDAAVSGLHQQMEAQNI